MWILLYLIILLFGDIVMRVATQGEIAPRTFVCVDSSEILLSNVCNGNPNCPDSSDETRTLCRHVTCPKAMYRCAYGACISRALRCNGFNDCADGSDEFYCDRRVEDVCSDREFQCSTLQKECIALSDVCNGYIDCSDGSDETEILCRDYSCPDNTFRCDYGGCIHQEVLCDSIKDCMDGSDENPVNCAAINCQGDGCSKRECRENEFSCNSGGQCIPDSKICDGKRQCRDGSDENPETCKSRTCPNNWFRCSYGACIKIEYKCNLQPDCYDWSDEDESQCNIILPEGACRLPGPKPGSHYSVSNCPRCRPGEVVPELTRLDFTCDGTLEGSTNVYCQRNSWIPGIPTCLSEENSQITCPPILDAYGALKRCEVKWGPKKGWVSCQEPLPVGTRVFLECPVFYERISGSSVSTCLHDGTWSQTPLNCRPVCGVRDSSAAALIVSGWEIKLEQSLPWHATLFSHEEGKWHFFCGGTLIAERIVLTAGHCVWKTSPETIRVAFGILSSDLTEAGDESQIIDVEDIKLQTAYQDHEGNYNSDIALLILKIPVLINSFVRPACINSNDSILLEAQRKGETGLVLGMGFTENNTFSKTLRATFVKIISEEICREKQKRDFRKYLTYTSFCAGWANGTGVCNGDSGGGLVLQKGNTSIWEVHGVVSVSPRRLGTSVCDPNFYTVFTKVSSYVEWILQITENIPVIGPPDIERQPNKDDIII